MDKSPKLFFSGRSKALLYVWAATPGKAFILRSDTPSAVKAVVSCDTKTETYSISFNQQFSLDISGIWRISLQQTYNPVVFCFEAEDGLYPFIVPGPGIVPSHFPSPEPSLIIAGGNTGEFFIDVPVCANKLCVALWSNQDADYRLLEPSGSISAVEWMPRGKKSIPYRVADVDITEPELTGLWKVEVFNPRNYRLTEWNGLPIFLLKPARRFSYAMLNVKAHHNNESIPFRATIIREGGVTAALDFFADEDRTIPVIPVDAEIRVNAGFSYGSARVHCPLSEKPHQEMEIELPTRLQPPRAWIRGDHHMHSYYEDGGSAPEKIIRAAAANGLDYIFITDLDVNCLIDGGLFDFNLEGKFIALPGQELMNKRTHMNALHIFDSIDTEEDESSWIAQVRASAKKNKTPALLMLNHPSHVPETMAGGAYFRSWWVAARYDEVELVENCDFRTWFDFLNRGRRLVRLWTTDTHDGTYYIPGMKCSFVYTGGKLTGPDIIEALRTGRVTNSVSPGVFLNMTVNGRGLGETVSTTEMALNITVSCEANCSISRIELIQNGEVAHCWQNINTESFIGKLKIDNVPGWFIARAFLSVERACLPPVESDNDQTIRIGCHAFTNPVWVAGKDVNELSIRK